MWNLITVITILSLFYSQFQITLHCDIPNFVAKFGNSLRSSKVHFRIHKPVCKQRCDLSLNSTKPIKCLVITCIQFSSLKRCGACYKARSNLLRITSTRDKCARVRLWKLIRITILLVIYVGQGLCKVWAFIVTCVL